MAKLELIRTERAETYTLGILREYASDYELCRTIERAWLDNVAGVSCIPEGTYEVVPDDMGKHRYFKLIDVPGRADIEMHVANSADQLNGCIACGDAVTTHTSGKRWVMNSTATMDMLRDRYPDGFTLVIRSV